MNNFVKGPKKNDDKSALAMLKKYELHDRTEQSVVDRDTRRESNHGAVWVQGRIIFMSMFITSHGELNNELGSDPGQIMYGRNSEIWMARNAKLREKHKWAIEKPKIDNADYEETISLTLRTRCSKKPWGMLEKKLETPMAPAMLCKTCKKSKHGETRNKTNEFKSNLACILEASESTRMRLEESLPNYHEDHITAKGDNSLQHYNLDAQGDGAHKACQKQAAADSRGSRTCVCASTFDAVEAHAGFEKDELTSCRGTV